MPPTKMDNESLMAWVILKPDLVNLDSHELVKKVALSSADFAEKVGLSSEVAKLKARLLSLLRINKLKITLQIILSLQI